MEEHVRLREFVEAIISREVLILKAEIALVAEKLVAVKETAAALYPEMMRRLEELNSAAARRSDQEKSDRLAYVQASEFKEWRLGIEKDLREIKETLSQNVGQKIEATDHRVATEWKWIALVGLASGLVLVVVTALITRYFHQ